MGGEIVIRDLEVFYRVGVTEAERAKPQRLLVTIQLELDLQAAARSDRLEDTIDYHAVVQDLIVSGNGRTWNLIEKVAGDIAELVRAKYKPRSVRVCVKKFVIAQAEYVSVSVERHRTSR